MYFVYFVLLTMLEVIHACFYIDSVHAIPNLDPIVHEIFWNNRVFV